MSQGWCGAGLCRRGIAAAEQRRRNAGDGVLATRVAYTPLQRAQKEEGCQEVLTEARNRAGRPCRGGGVDGEQRRTDGVVEEAAAGVLRAPGLCGSTLDVPAEVLLGSV